MRKNKLLALLLLFAISAKAQVKVILSQPNKNQLSTYNIFNFQAINGGSTAVHVAIEGVVTLNNSQPIYSVKYSVIELQPGATLFNYANLSPVQENYGSSEQASTLQTTGLVPFGNYSICIKITDAGSNTALDNSCIEYTSMPASPPELSSPGNETEIETTVPLLTWIPPTPVQDGSNLKYDLKLVEIFNGQNAYDALARNPALLQQTSIEGTVLPYPSNAFPLEIGKKYAWQVTAKNNRYTIGSTETWSFKIVSKKEETTEEKPETGAYLKLKKVMDGSYSIVVSDLRFAYEEAYGSGDLHYRITDLDGKDFTPTDMPLSYHVGDNRYEIPLTKKTKLKNDTYYILEVTTANKERRVMVFKFYKNEDAFRRSKS